jgi:hypothetical protein
MREPTEEMIEGGHYSDRPTFHHENYGAWFAERQRVETIYRAMIGKALGE